jgi:tetratricopeptide (TPR) repeat protein
VLGQLNTDSFTRIQLEPLSREAVDLLAEEKGYKGSAIYHLSGGNPFYVNELLANYNKGLPDNIKDSIINSFNRQEEKSRQVWELLSVIPASFEVKYLEKFEPMYAAAIERCLESKILFIRDEHISFKHELFRRTIESSLSPLRRVYLNKRILDLLKESFEQNKEIERIIHHAKNANEYETVSYYAPLAASEAASVGAHIEASRLYLTAIEYYQGNDKDILVQLFESYAYECYLTNQVKEAIIYTGKALAIWKEKNNAERAGNNMRFLSRLWWFDDNSKNAKKFAEQAIETFKDEPSSPAKAMAYSNMSQLKMLFDEIDECIAWGEKAIAMAKELGDERTLSHALNNVGSVYMYMPLSAQKGIELLQQSLRIGLKNSFPEHTARAYSNLGSISLKQKNYVFAQEMLDEGIKYAEERNLDSSRVIMLTLKSALLLETGDWENAYAIAGNLLKNENHLSAFTIFLLPVAGTIKMRRGDTDTLPLLQESYFKAFETTELQRIIPSLVALLEYEWLTGKIFIKTEDLERSKEMIAHSIYTIEKNEFAFWLKKARKEQLPLIDLYEGYDVSTVKKAQKAAALWEKTRSPYMQALTLFEGNEDDKKNALRIVHELGASNQTLLF